MINNLTHKYSVGWKNLDIPRKDMLVMAGSFQNLMTGNKSNKDGTLALRHIPPISLLASECLPLPPGPAPPAQSSSNLSSRHFEFRVSVLSQITHEDQNVFYLLIFEPPMPPGGSEPYYPSKNCHDQISFILHCQCLPPGAPECP